MLENREISSENGIKSPKNAENALDFDTLEKLRQRYPILGTFAPATDFSSFTILYYDFVGNQLTVTIETGKCLSYEETPVVHKEVYWDDEAGMHRHRVKGETKSAEYTEEAEAPTSL